MSLVTSIATVATGVVATGGAVVGVTASTTGAPGPVSPDGHRLPCGAVWDRLPDGLQDDLAALRDLAPGERRPAVREIRRNALAGDYGDRVQTFAEQRVGRPAQVWDRLPRELRHDVREARRSGDPDAREEIRSKALEGAYGERVQAAAERMQDRRAICGADGATP